MKRESGHRDEMPYISVRQPWAWLIMEGHKDIENRNAVSHHRGELLIHASSNRTGLKKRIEEVEEDYGISESIPLFDPSQRATAENGRIDRVKLSCYLGTLSTLHDDDFPHFRNCLGYLENGLFCAPPDGGESHRPTLNRDSETFFRRNGKAGEPDSMQSQCKVTDSAQQKRSHTICVTP
jgi:hypothetical protein